LPLRTRHTPCAKTSTQGNQPFQPIIRSFQKKKEEKPNHQEEAAHDYIQALQFAMLSQQKSSSLFRGGLDSAAITK